MPFSAAFAQIAASSSFDSFSPVEGQTPEGAEKHVGSGGPEREPTGELIGAPSTGGSSAPDDASSPWKPEDMMYSQGRHVAARARSMHRPASTAKADGECGLFA